MAQGKEDVVGTPQGSPDDAPKGKSAAGDTRAPATKQKPTVSEALHALIAGLTGTRAASWYRACAVVVAVPAAVVLALVVLGVIPVENAGGANPKRLKPYEYVYLDSARVKTYLGQLDEGDVNQETRTATSKDTAGGKFEIEALGEASGSVTNEKTRSAVVAFSEADNFYKLERTLEGDGELTPVQL